jgi:cytidylate kinase
LKIVTIAIDGPAGAGKSTISKIVARKLNIEYVDTGAMYRAITLKILKNNISIDDIESIKDMLENTEITLDRGRTYLDGNDVSEEIRIPYITDRVSEISAMSIVREKLVDMQRRMALEKSVIMDGRDIGTNVLKNANYKIYLTATVEERAKRRHEELIRKNIKMSFEDVCTDIENRDKYDMSRKINPLCMAEDAILVDTTSKGINEVVDEILKIVKRGKVL